MYEENNNIDFIVKAYELYVGTLDNAEFEINPTQYEKLCNAVQFLIEIVKKNKGVIEPISMEPNMLSGGASAFFDILNLWGDDIAKLKSVLGDITALGISIRQDKVCVEFTIPGVFCIKDKI